MKANNTAQPTHHRFAFDISALEVFLPLSVGATLVVASADEVVDGQRLRRLVDGGATILQATPTTWRLLLGAGWQGGEGFRALCGGEALAPDLARELARRSEAWNLYGPTETTVWSTTHAVVAGEAPVPIGRPIANAHAYVLDA